VNGTVGLTGNYNVDANVSIVNLTLVDPGLYEATLGGDLRFRGPALDGGRLSGDITLSEAELRIPETGAGAAGSIPDIEHLGTPADVRRTLDKAGLSTTATPEAADEGPGITIPLDVTISAPSRIFVRGRGLDAELGGQIRLTGTTADIIPIGRFDLVRGRLLLLGQRFDFDEGYISLEGALVPVIRLVVETEQGDVMTYIIVDGEASSPEVSFSSSPELPEDEVLAQLLFGRDMSRLSAFQALQLANAVAVLAGRGGEGIVSRLRQGFDLDDLDVTTDEQGNAALRAGKYISDNVYTDVTVGATGQTELNLNIDISPSVTARGGVDNDGQSSVGIFFERDY
jgi:translocation and assembly module TamB